MEPGHSNRDGGYLGLERRAEENCHWQYPAARDHELPELLSIFAVKSTGDLHAAVRGR